MERKRKEELRSLTIQLKDSFRPRVLNQSQLETLFSLGKYAPLISIMKNHLGVMCGLSVKCISAPLPRDGKVPACYIDIPEYFPIYGSEYYKGMRLNIYFNKEITNNFHSFIQSIAHELCHIVLHSLNHPLKASEEATDITAILLGFGINYELGQTFFNNTLSEKRIFQLGYLSLEEIFFVLEIIEE